MVVKKKVKVKQIKINADKIQATLTGASISSNSQKAMQLFGSKRFGEQKQGKIIYSIYEALYLLETNKIEIYQKNKKLDFPTLLKKVIRKDKKADIKYIVFKDMRKRGYTIKTALKFGADFRVYEKGAKIGKAHAKYILYPVPENEQLRWHEFSAKQRVAHSTKKNLLIAIVDEEEDITYYNVSWVRP